MLAAFGSPPGETNPTCQARDDIPVRIEVDLQLTDMALNLSPDVVVSILVKVPDLVKMASMVSTAPRDDDGVRADESGEG